MPRYLPGDGSQDGLLMYLLERLVQMPYLWWVWVMVLFACFMFSALDRKRILGTPQLVSGGGLLIVLTLFGSETQSVGYYITWALGVVGLATFWICKLHEQWTTGH